MLLRRLERQEHKTTRALWESVFAEDTAAFLDYYYSVKTRDNTIYVADADDKIRAMLQLNPYKVQLGGQKFLTHYIIGVATEEAYRGQGMMRRLLLEAMQDMYRKKEPFTFLMPAAEAIYTPYDFRFIYRQRQMKLRGRQLDLSEKKDIRVIDAKPADAGKLACFARKVLADSYQVYAVRTKAYYETVLLEQRSEDGGVQMVYEGRKLVGILAYDREEGVAVREPLFLPGYEEVLLHAIYELTGDELTEVLCIGGEERLCSLLRNTGIGNVELKPVIMARILYLERFLKALKTVDNQPFSCSFAVIDPLLVQNNRIVSLTYDTGLQEMIVRDTEDSDGVITIDAFTSMIFGYRSMDDIEEDDGVLLTEKFRTEFAKIVRFREIFLNEIV